ncbi:MAG: hypothetical protein KAH95_16295 [Spirochaetales bacterium]|nr:hypothetical protein [Spirochaetales bacterium]
MKKILPLLIVLTLFGTTGTSIFADEINTGRFNNTAIGGYDPVGYHLVGIPQKGNAEFSLLWKDAEWRFISRNNLNLFESDPERYVPRFGGFCANGLSDGHKIRGNPKIWRIYKNRLFLFYSKRGRDSWDLDTDNKIHLASEYWEKVQFD